MKGLKRFMAAEPSVPVAAAVLLIIVAIWVVMTPNLNIVSITYSVASKLPLVLVAMAEAVVIMSKGIDLSVGAVLTVVNVMVATGGMPGHNFALWLIGAMLVATAAGAINGLLVALFNIPSLVVTLATQTILFGVALYIMPTPTGEIPQWFANIPLLAVGPIPMAIVLLIGLPIVLWWPLKRSKFGPALYAVGSDVEAAYANGIPVKRTLVRAYALSGFFSGVGGLLVTINAGSGDPNIGMPYVMNAIAAAVIGGVALLGGRGTIVGTVLGALILSYINNLLFSIGVSTYWQYVVAGSVLILALAIPLLIKTISNARQRRLA